MRKQRAIPCIGMVLTMDQAEHFEKNDCTILTEILNIPYYRKNRNSIIWGGTAVTVVKPFQEPRDSPVSASEVAPQEVFPRDFQ